MPRASCPKCKFTFNVKDPSRKSVECPDCGARVALTGNGPPPPPAPPSRHRREEAADAPAKRGVPALLIVGGLLVLFVGLAAVGGGIWYFAIRKPNDPAPVLQADTRPIGPEPIAEPKIDPKQPVKRLKVGQAPELRAEDVFHKLLPSTVMITYPSGRQPESVGSGVLICRDPNLILTNVHVVGDHKVVDVYFPDLLPNGSPEKNPGFYIGQRARMARQARVLGRDEGRDTAIIMLEGVPDNAQPIPLASDSAKPLVNVHGIGNSGVNRGALFDAYSGVVKGVNETNKYTGRLCKFLETTQPINQGDSGGPIVNGRLELVAIAQSKAIKYLAKEGNNVVIKGEDNVSHNVDVSELREFANRVYRDQFGSEFPSIHPAAEVGIDSPPDGEDLTLPDYVQILREGDSTQARAAIGRLVHLGVQSVGPLREVLEDQRAAPRWPLALEALERIGDPAIDATDIAVKKLRSDNPDVRVAAAKYLAAMGHPSRKHVPALVEAGGINNPSVRAACEKAVIKLGPFASADLDMILGKGDDKDEYMRSFRVKLLVEVDLSQDEKVRLMEKYFKDPHSAVRAEVIRAVCKPGKFPRQDMHRLVIPLLADVDFVVRVAALEHLFGVGRVEVADLETFRPFFKSDSLFVHRYLLERVRELGEKASPIVPELSKSLGLPDDEIKETAFNAALGINRDLKVLSKDFIALSKHEKPAFRWSAVQCLKQIGKDEPGVLTAMFERLSDGAELSNPPRNLTELADKSFADTKDKVRLIADLPPVNPKARPVWQFTTVLMNEMRPFKTEAQVKDIKAFLKPDDKRSMYAQFYAAQCIAESGQAAKPALDDLISTLENPKVTDYEIRAKLCEGIGNCGEEASRAAKLLATMATFEILEDRARTPGDAQRMRNQKVRSAALQAIGKMGRGAKDALPGLAVLADPGSDEATADEAIKALGNIGPPAADATPRLMEMFQVARPAQRDLIVSAMVKIGPDAYTPIIDFFPKFEKHWREGVGQFKGHAATAKGCVEYIIIMGPTSLKTAQVANLVGALKATRARAVIRGDNEFQGRISEALMKLEVAKK
jgi:S1-C subfamily serine protease/HEAT repeat protein